MAFENSVTMKAVLMRQSRMGNIVTGEGVEGRGAATDIGTAVADATDGMEVSVTDMPPVVVSSLPTVEVQEPIAVYQGAPPPTAPQFRALVHEVVPQVLTNMLSVAGSGGIEMPTSATVTCVSGSCEVTFLPNMGSSTLSAGQSMEVSPGVAGRVQDFRIMGATGSEVTLLVVGLPGEPE